MTLPTPYYDHGGITIYHGDCREILPHLGRFDLLLTDIPYAEVSARGAERAAYSGQLRGLDKAEADTETVTALWLTELAAPLCASAYVFCGFGQISALHLGFKSHGHTTRLGVWEKTNPSPMNGEHLWLSSVEPCIVARAPGATFNEHCASPVWRCPSVAETPHPTGKPTKLFRRLIEASSKPGDLVVDLTMGAGTTLRAAKDTGRRAIGIELEERWCAYAVNRLRQEVLFSRPPEASRLGDGKEP